DEVGSHLTLGLLKTPVPHVLQHGQTQRDLGRCLLPPLPTAVRPPPPLGFIDGLQQLGVVQHRVDALHPLFPPALRLAGKPSLPPGPLLVPQFNHRPSSALPFTSRPWSSDATARGSLRPSRRPPPKTLSRRPAPGAPPRRARPAHTELGSCLRSGRSGR